MTFPTQRPRRLRRTELLRSMVRETRLSADGFVYPMFVCPGSNVRQEVSSMPGVHQQSVDQIVEECREVAGLGIPAVILFGLPETKDGTGGVRCKLQVSCSGRSRQSRRRSSICW